MLNHCMQVQIHEGIASTGMHNVFQKKPRLLIARIIRLNYIFCVNCLKAKAIIETSIDRSIDHLMLPGMVVTANMFPLRVMRPPFSFALFPPFVMDISRQTVPKAGIRFPAWPDDPS